jgi:ubiquinone biosynthesis protein UbiJ
MTVTTLDPIDDDLDEAASVTAEIARLEIELGRLARRLERLQTGITAART